MKLGLTGHLLSYWSFYCEILWLSPAECHSGGSSSLARIRTRSWRCGALSHGPAYRPLGQLKTHTHIHTHSETIHWKVWHKLQLYAFCFDFNTQFSLPLGFLQIRLTLLCFPVWRPAWTSLQNVWSSQTYKEKWARISAATAQITLYPTLHNTTVHLRPTFRCFATGVPSWWTPFSNMKLSSLSFGFSLAMFLYSWTTIGRRCLLSNACVCPSLSLIHMHSLSLSLSLCLSITCALTLGLSSAGSF